MHRRFIKTILTTLIAACAGSCFAQSMSEDEYSADRSIIDAQYHSAAASCDAASDGTQGMCNAEARGNRGVAAAGLELRYSDNVRNRYRLSLARADAAYALAQAECADSAIGARNACLAQARSTLMVSRAQARTESGNASMRLGAEHDAGAAGASANAPRNQPASAVSQPAWTW
jgi:hypothetical protein